MKREYVLLAIGFFSFCALLVAFFLPHDFNTQESVRINPTRTISVNSVPINVEIVDTDPARAQGLSGITGLGENEGMLFVFPQEALYSFWMHEMLFSIDILWIDEKGTVIHVEKNLSPETYPQSFTSHSPARYVLEVPAGFSDRYGITIGVSASIE